MPHQDVAADTPAAQHLARRRIWESKYAIRACYQGWYRRLQPFIAEGVSLEIGSGSGHFSQLWKGLLTSDVVATPYVDLVADGQRLPLASGSLGNLLVVDLLHHLADPHLFFDEAARVLRKGGRVLAIEPYITPLSWLGYRLFHHEPVWFGGYHRSSTKVDPWEGNLALPNLLFARERDAWPQRHPSLRIVHTHRFGVLDFQLAGGFKPYAFVGNRRLYDLCISVDQCLDWLAPLAAFRILAVIEKV